jgi:uncharacterized protein YjbI with pentapeptide repeats
MARHPAEDAEKVQGRERLDAFARRSISIPVRMSLPVVSLILALATPAVQAASCAALPATGVDWRRCQLDTRDLRGVDLTGAVLRDASLSRSNLEGAVLVRVDGNNARFTSAEMRGADLSGAVLVRADFTRADLNGAKFAGADLRRAQFFGADLRNADFTAARMDGVDLLRARLDGARWTDGTSICAAGSVGACE